MASPTVQVSIPGGAALQGPGGGSVATRTGRPARPLKSVSRGPSVAGKALLMRGPAESWDRLAAVALETARALDAKGVVWVCFQHPASKIRARLMEAGWSGRLDLVDAISRSSGLGGEDDGVSYSDSPGGFHTVLASLSPLLKDGPRVVVWDSLNAVLPYATGESLLRTMAALNARVHQARSAVVYFLVEGSADAVLARSLEGSVDRILVHRPRATWKQVLSLERPLLYAIMAAMASVNAGLALAVLRLILP